MLATTFLRPLLAVLCLFALTLGAQAHTKKNQKVLFILSASEHGYWLPEVLTPYQIQTDAGFAVEFASPAGDPGFQAGGSTMNEQEKHTLANLRSVLAKPLSLSAIDPVEYAALYVPGGAGPMFDLLNHPEVNRITAAMFESGKPVSADCHGPAAFVGVRLSNGELMVSGKKLTAKSNAEENEWARNNYPFLLEDKFKQINSQFSAAPPQEPWVVRDENLLTGQNPASSGPLAEALISLIRSGANPSTKVTAN